MEMSPTVNLRPQVLVVGAGFAGLEVVKALGRAGISVTLVDRQNHHLFQPLLYQVATAALAAPDVAEPIRRIVRKYPSVQVAFGEVVDVDTNAREVRFADGQAMPFDYLVLATGSVPSYFGHDDWARWAPGLKTIEDARHIRSQLLLSFEKAERTADPTEQARLMTVAIIGGGPTGVELAGSIAELSRYTLARDFRNIDPESTNIILVEAAPQILGGFSEGLTGYALQRLERLGVTVLTRSRVEDISADGMVISGQYRPVGLVLWAAGVTASPLALKVGGEVDRGGRLIVDRCLRVAAQPNIFALGDVAHFADDAGRPLPGLAQVAKQQGSHLGQALAEHLSTGRDLPPFTYRSRGNTAIIGRHAAIFEQGSRQVKGWVAWLAWAVIHVYLLIGFQNRVLVSIQWLWLYLTYERGARLITEVPNRTNEPPALPEMVEPPNRSADVKIKGLH
ncbi:MAG: NAD(P)/FAD-dependent oxidoreductase [Mesorhizobium sp.]|nr:NAD(P)/FAD-dependent oxidoreductase [Mesorhizobium sp.]